jgi:hypothetical protein
MKIPMRRHTEARWSYCIVWMAQSQRGKSQSASIDVGQEVCHEKKK